MLIVRKARKLRVLDFDTECRPMHYSEWRPESQITAYGWSFLDDLLIRYRVLDPDCGNEREILEDFLEAFLAADIVMGHYIRKHDLPLINDHCISLGLPPISERWPRLLTIDTKLDVPQVKGLGLSQENLSDTFQLTEDKHHMSGARWKRANTLAPAGVSEAIQRVTSDVEQNIALYHELVARGALRAPRVWP
jgi:hypothetical protein